MVNAPLSVKVIHKRRFTCSKDKLIDQFKVTFERMNVMAREMKFNPISTRGGGCDLAPCYTFVNNFLFTSAFFVKFYDFS